jgi:hypothetical protein
VIPRVLALAAALLFAGAAAADSPLRPPVLSIASKAGIQDGVQGSYCIRDAAQGVCADSTQPHPTLVSVVRPGARLALRTSDGTLTKPTFSVGALGCSGTGPSRAVRLRGDVWRITAPARPGGYELLVSTRFTAAETHGDTMVGVGILVSRTKARRILPAKRFAVC